jgi:hypothetical protein
MGLSASFIDYILEYSINITITLKSAKLALESVLHGKRPRKRKLPFRIAAKVVVFVKSYF